jgi:ATP-binding cassette subfamily A (ABC1) protein 3
MEECEALCNRLIIMVNGKICCIGSPQQLKNKFGKGFTVLIKVSTRTYERRLSRTDSQSQNTSINHLRRQSSVMSSDLILIQNINKVKSFMAHSFPGSQLKAIHNNLLHYSISDETLSWSRVFGLIEKSKDALSIEDYSIGRTTLEQIFLSFARKQRETSD